MMCKLVVRLMQQYLITDAAAHAEREQQFTVMSICRVVPAFFAGCYDTASPPGNQGQPRAAMTTATAAAAVIYLLLQEVFAAAAADAATCFSQVRRRLRCRRRLDTRRGCARLRKPAHTGVVDG
jgi:hypothetical protein